MITFLLHLPTNDPDRHAQLAETALKPARDFVKFTLVRIPTSSVPGAMHDTQSIEVLCAKTHAPLDPNVIKAMRWAVHKRFADTESTHARLRCDLIGGDESRVKRKKGRQMARK